MLKIEIKTSGAAYRDNCEMDKDGNYILDKNATELIRNLKEIINKLECGYVSGNVIDINGNKSGSWTLED